MDNREKQEAYRERMYAAGYKQVRSWVPRKAEGKPVKMERLAFIKFLDGLTLGWSKARLARFLAVLAQAAVKMAKKEAKQKK